MGYPVLLINKISALDCGKSFTQREKMSREFNFFTVTLLHISRRDRLLEADGVVVQ